MQFADVGLRELSVLVQSNWPIDAPCVPRGCDASPRVYVKRNNNDKIYICIYVCTHAYSYIVHVCMYINTKDHFECLLIFVFIKEMIFIIYIRFNYATLYVVSVFLELVLKQTLTATAELLTQWR